MQLESGRGARRAAHARILLIFGACIALSGCSWFSSSSSSKGPPPASCPTAAILRPLAQTAVFTPGGPRQPTGVQFYGILSEVEVKCDRSGDVLRATLDIVVIAERGPAVGGASEVDLQYFVAVTTPDQTILSKRTLPVHITIPGNARRAGITDRIEESISLAGRMPGDLNIMIGFQQGPEVVEFYKNYRGR